MNDTLVVVAWIAGILIVLLLGKVMMLPLKLILKLVLNGVLGGIAIFFINLLGNLIGFTIPLNLFSALVAGILGLPGIILLVILKFLL